jgi:Uncharacterised protein family (UPF0180)
LQRIAVESGLTPISEYLSSRGYQVEPLDASRFQQGGGNPYAAIVISGQDQDLTGIQERVQDCPVINARGLTPEEVHDRLRRLPQ